MDEVKAQLVAVSEDWGLPTAAAQVITSLILRAEGSTVGALAEEHGMSTTSVAGALQLLLQHGWARRERGGRNRLQLWYYQDTASEWDLLRRYQRNLRAFEAAVAAYPGGVVHDRLERFRTHLERAVGLTAELVEATRGKASPD